MFSSQLVILTWQQQYDVTNSWLDSIMICQCVISVGPCVISRQMFVKSEFPFDSALVSDSD